MDGVLTGRENLRMIGKLRHLPDVNKKADELLERFQLLDAADRQVATHPGGMRRRLDLAMSLIGNPPVLFLDDRSGSARPFGHVEDYQRPCSFRNYRVFNYAAFRGGGSACRSDRHPQQKKDCSGRNSGTREPSPCDCQGWLILIFRILFF